MRSDLADLVCVERDMAVLGRDGSRIGTVDRLEDGQIRLAGTAGRRIPFADVAVVDVAVRLR